MPKEYKVVGKAELGKPMGWILVKPDTLWERFNKWMGKHWLILFIVGMLFGCLLANLLTAT